MYHRPEINPFLMGQALTVADLLADGLSLDDAYSQLPADLRCDCDAELDAHLPWRRPAAVLRELHRTRAAEILASRPCPTCARALVPELLVPIAHPSDPERTVTLLDSLLDVAGGHFEFVAGTRSLAQVVDAFVSTHAVASCRMPCCPRASDRGDSRVPAFAVSLLSLLAAWAYEAGLNRDIEPVVTAAWTAALDELADSPDGSLMTSNELLEAAAVDPRVVAAELHVPERWVDSDWGTLVLTRNESPTFAELAAELGVSPERAALSALEVTNWLAAQVDALFAT